MNRSVKAGFILVQADGAGSRSDAEIERLLGKFLSIWADTVDGELAELDITVEGSEPALCSAVKSA